VTRANNRASDEMRPITLTPGFMPYAEGSCLVETGSTRVICSATLEEGVPRWMQGRGKGWVTAEYSMLPRSSPTRIPREVNKGRPSGRTQEIQRLIGRSLRAVIDMSLLGERTVWLDCDVLQADAGTRTASVTGAYVAMAEAIEYLVAAGSLRTSPLLDTVSAVSVGIIEGVPCLDLDYEEDSSAQVDMNVVMTGSKKLVEVQGTAEQGAFERSELDLLIDLATKGVAELTICQEQALQTLAPR
jgi:ribonuclease PH